MDENKTKEPITQETALEMALLLSVLSAGGRKGDEYKKSLIETFTTMLDGFGYKVAAK